MPSDSYIPKYINDNTGEVLEYLGKPVIEVRHQPEDDEDLEEGEDNEEEEL